MYTHNEERSKELVLKICRSPRAELDQAMRRYFFYNGRFLNIDKTPVDHCSILFGALLNEL